MTVASDVSDDIRSIDRVVNTFRDVLAVKVVKLWIDVAKSIVRTILPVVGIIVLVVGLRA